MVSFSIAIKKKPKDKITNVLHFTTGGNNKGFGSRIPAVWVDKRFNDLFIRVNTDGVNGRINFRTSFRAELGKKYDITIKQWVDRNNKYWYQLIIPGVRTRRFPVYQYNGDWKTFYNVELYTSDPWRPSFTSDLGTLSNLKIENNEGDLISLDKDAPLQ